MTFEVPRDPGLTAPTSAEPPASAFTPFTFFLYDGTDKPPSFEIELFAQDAEAMRHGRSLLDRRARYVAVEVVEGARSLAKLTRGDGEGAATRECALA